MHDFLLVGHRKYSAMLYHFELFDIEYNRDLEFWIIGHWRSVKLVSFESLAVFFYSPSIVTMAVYLTVYKIFSVKY